MQQLVFERGWYACSLVATTRVISWKCTGRELFTQGIRYCGLDVLGGIGRFKGWNLTKPKDLLAGNLVINNKSTVSHAVVSCVQTVQCCLSASL